MEKTKKLVIMALACIVLSLTVVAVASAADEYDFGSYGSESLAPLAFFTGAMCIIPIIMIIIGIVLAVWVYKDAEKRGSSGVLWLLIVLVTGIIGLIIWLVVRPSIGGKKPATDSDRKCPSCGRVIPQDARTCPYCGKNFEA